MRGGKNAREFADHFFGARKTSPLPCALKIKCMAKVLAHGIVGFSGSGAPTVLLTI